MRGLFKRVSLRVLIIIMVLSVFIISLLIGGTYLIKTDEDRFKEELVEYHLTISDLFARDIASNLTFYYKEGIKNTVEKLRSIPSINYAEVYGETDTVVTSYTKMGRTKVDVPLFNTKSYIFVENMLHLRKTIIQDGVYTGYLYFQINMEAMKSHKNDLYKSMAITFLIILVLAVVLSILFQKIITKPILELKQITTDMAGSNQYDNKIEVKGYGEIRSLYKSFSMMISEINSYNAQTIEANNKLKKYTHELEDSNKELENFAYVASHDLQEPLRKILTFSSRIDELEKDDLNERFVKYLEIITRSSYRMQSLINDLLTFSRVKTDVKHIKKIDLNVVLKDVLDDLDLMINKFKAKILADKLPMIEGEEIQLRQVFQNIISNSIKYAKPGVSPEINIRILKNTNSLVEISFDDNGIGFKNDYAEKIFTIFQRLHGKNEYEGTGLGLAIVRKIVQRHNGSIYAKGELGKGATFILNLPKKQDN